MVSRFRTLVMVAALAGLSTAQVDAQADNAREWRFRVLLDEQEVGVHTFRVSELEDGQQVDIDASFDVRFLFFNAFSYRHNNTERWVNGCLREIRSDTRAGRKEYRVRGTAESDRFAIETHAETFELDSPCVQSFAYWDPAILEATRLVNAQTGEWVEITVEPDGREELDVQGLSIPAQKYAIQMEKGVISLWYGPDGRWLSLEAPAPGGRVLRYLPERVPAGSGGGRELAKR